MTGQLVRIHTRGTGAVTDGLLARGHPEIVVGVESGSLVTAASAFLRFVVAYIEDGATIHAGETLSYGYWLTLFKENAPNRLDVWEHNPQATDYVRGATLTLGYWRDQHAACTRFGSDFAPPRPDQLVVLSNGVVEGEVVQGVRYPSPEHMSGWWITTQRYDGDIKSLRLEHLSHLTAARPDLAQYLALSCGFRFDLASREDVWFDAAIAEQTP